ncbi:MAG: TssN family type VI secretion system protein [Chitinophagaceae bacterium]
MNKHAMTNFSKNLLNHLPGKINKKSSWYFFIELALAVLFCLIPAAGLTIKLLQLLLFLLLGIFNVWFLGKEYKAEQPTGLHLVIALGALQFIMMIMLLLVVHAVLDNAAFSIAFAGSAAFFLPLMVQCAWKLFAAIPVNTPLLWYLPEGEPEPATAFRQTMLVQLQIKREPGQQQANTYPLTVSAKLKLGKVFEKLIVETKQAGRNKIIAVKDQQEQPYGWQFFEIRWLGFYKRFLDPSLSLLGNKIKANAKIIIVRAAIEQ